MTNTVELLGHYGDDLIHACSAWTSTSRELTDEKIGRVPKLLTMLASEGHHTPFEKSSLHFLVTVDQATHIHLLKHRIGVSINGESARYKELKEDKMYIPTEWSNSWKDKLQKYAEEGNKLYHESLEYFTPI
jgi:thymidylate synthase ThyX